MVIRSAALVEELEERVLLASVAGVPAVPAVALDGRVEGGGGEGELAGYHCCAKFRAPGKGWVPADISEANKNPKMKDSVAVGKVLSIGREDVPSVKSVRELHPDDECHGACQGNRRNRVDVASRSVKSQQTCKQSR